MDQLHLQRADLLGQRHVRRQRAIVHAVGKRQIDHVAEVDAAQRIDHLLHDLHGHIALRLDRVRADVRRGNHVLQRQQLRQERIGLGRLAAVHVDAGARDFAGHQRLVQRLLVVDAAARAVDQDHAIFHLRDLTRADHAARLFGQRRVNGDDVGSGQQFVEIAHQVHVNADRPLLRQCTDRRR